jgi:hypothetical protein
MSKKKVMIGTIIVGVLGVIFAILAIVGASIKNKQGDTNMEIGKGDIGVTTQIPDNVLANDKGVFIGIQDPNVYYNGEGNQYKVKSRMVSVTGKAEDQEFCVADVQNMISKIVLGDAEFDINTLVSYGNDGSKVLEDLNNAFGIKIYTEDNTLESTPGKVSLDALGGSYSYTTTTRDGYTGYVYFFDVNFNSMDAATYEKCKDEYGLNDNPNLTGELSLEVFEDKDGNQAGYILSIDAPVYYDSFENFKANVNARMRYDITKCCVIMTDGTPVGFAEDLTIKSE